MTSDTFIDINGRIIGKNFLPLVIPEIGINHEGDFNKAKKMILDAKKSGAECVKFQCHIVEDEMIKNNVVPGNSKQSIWEIIKRCSLSEEEDFKLKEYAEKLGLIYLSTPFSRAAADRLNEMNIAAFKIGSGECNNYPLIKHIAKFGKPIILSTGMNNIKTIIPSVELFKKFNVPYGLLHTTSLYPTPYKQIRLGALRHLKKNFPNCVIGLSDHSIGNYTCFGAVSLGASILEKHFTSNKFWSGPDISISINPKQLKELIIGCNAIHESLGGRKEILSDESITSAFAYASVVSTKDIKKGTIFSEKNIWVKRPGTGEIHAKFFEKILKKTANYNIKKDTQLTWNMIN